MGLPCGPDSFGRGVICNVSEFATECVYFCDPSSVAVGAPGEPRPYQWTAFAQFSSVNEIHPNSWGAGELSAAGLGRCREVHREPKVKPGPE